MAKERTLTTNTVVHGSNNINIGKSIVNECNFNFPSEFASPFYNFRQSLLLVISCTIFAFQIHKKKYTYIIIKCIIIIKGFKTKSQEIQTKGSLRLLFIHTFYTHFVCIHFVFRLKLSLVFGLTLMRKKKKCNVEGKKKLWLGFCLFSSGV